MSIESLLKSLGWPQSESNSKGVLQWQGKSPQIPNKITFLSDIPLPPTATLTITPKSIRATVLNIESSSGIQPHFQAQWDISSGQPVIQKYNLAGENMLFGKDNPTNEDIAKNFSSLVLLVNSPSPKIDILGTRDKKDKTIKAKPNHSQSR